MDYRFNHILKKLGLFDYLKIFKDKYFKNPEAAKLEKKRYTFYSEFVKKGDTCFDIGANYGNRTEIFLRLGARVIAVEPQPQPGQFLKRKFKDKIILVQKAAGADNGRSFMYLSPASALSSLSEEWISKVRTQRFRKIKWNKKIEVEVVTLDSLIVKYGKPDFCKIDVEGFELEVIKGLTGPVNIISFEYTIPELLDRAIECISYIDRLGEMVYNYSPGETMQLALNKWLGSSEFIPLFRTLPSKNITDGDIYVKCLNNK